MFICIGNVRTALFYYLEVNNIGNYCYSFICHHKDVLVVIYFFFLFMYLLLWYCIGCYYYSIICYQENVLAAIVIHFSVRKRLYLGFISAKKKYETLLLVDSKKSLKKLLHSFQRCASTANHIKNCTWVDKSNFSFLLLYMITLWRSNKYRLLFINIRWRLIIKISR